MARPISNGIGEYVTNLVPWAGFEPATFPLGGGCAIQLCHQGVESLY